MLTQAVFQQAHELDRLAVQGRLLLSCEEPIFQHIFANRTGLRVLDIGCNNGQKTIQRFSHNAVARVIGLEFNEELARQARACCNSDKFSFYQCDVEAEDFSERLTQYMQENAIAKFDVVYLSFLLMHLKRPEKLLRLLHGFLAEDGVLVVIEANDSASFLEPAGRARFDKFLEILRQDPYSGNREMGKELTNMLRTCGFGDIRFWNEALAASDQEREMKQDIFTMFFSYLAEDVQLLRQQDPKDARYLEWEAWLEENLQPLYEDIVRDGSVISMGMGILTCGRG